MSIPSNGITPEVIRGVMTPYLLSLDLLHATFATLPAPPPGATTAWRRARVTRLAAEIVAPMPANADQARISAQLLIFRELADTFAKAARAPGQTPEQMCRLGRTASGLMRTAIELDRALARHQQKPAPYFGTLDDHEVDLAEVDAMWGGDPSQPAEPPPASPPRQPPRDATPPPTQPDPAPTLTDPQPAPSPLLPAQPAQSRDPKSPDPTTQPGEPPAPPRTRPAGADWMIEHLDQGPGYTREVLRRRTPADPAREPAE
jgi:hypothetical protein